MTTARRTAPPSTRYQLFDFNARFTADNALMVQAALLLVAHQCEAREAVTFASAYQLPFGVHDLLSPVKERSTGYRPEPEAA